MSEKLKITSKHLFLLTLLLIIFATLLLITNHPGLFLNLINYTFGILLVATLKYFFEVEKR